MPPPSRAMTSTCSMTFANTCWCATCAPGWVEPPALIKAYLRLGAKVLGAPAWDPDFKSADLPMMMRIGDLPPRYRKHFLGT